MGTEHGVDLGDLGVGDLHVVALLFALQHCLSLSHILLRGNLFGDMAASVVQVLFPILPNIQRLDLSNCFALSSIGMRRIFLSIAGWKNLSAVDFGGCDIGDIALPQLKIGLSGSCAGLRRLNLRRCRISRAGARELGDVLRSCSNLTELDLSWNPLEGAGIDSIADCLVVGLQTLNLSGPGCGHPGCVALVRKGWNVIAGLQNLILRDASIGDEGFGILVSGFLSHVNSLQILDVHNCGLHGESSGAVADLLCSETTHSLECLTLSNNYLTAEPWVQRRALSHCGRLRYLNINGCKLSGEDVNRLLGDIPPSLRHVCISGNFSLWKGPLAALLAEGLLENLAARGSRLLVLECEGNDVSGDIAEKLKQHWGAAHGRGQCGALQSAAGLILVANEDAALHTMAACTSFCRHS